MVPLGLSKYASTPPSPPAPSSAPERAYLGRVLTACELTHKLLEAGATITPVRADLAKVDLESHPTSAVREEDACITYRYPRLRREALAADRTSFAADRVPVAAPARWIS